MQRSEGEGEGEREGIIDCSLFFLYRLIPSHVIDSVKKLLSWLQDRLSLNTCDNDDLLLVSQCMITALAIDPELINTALPQLAM